MRAVSSGMQLAKDLGYEPNIIWQNNKEVGAGYFDLFADSYVGRYVREVSAFTYNLLYEIPRKRNLYISKIFQKALFDRFLSDESELLSMEGKPAEVVSALDNRNNVLIKSGLEFYPFQQHDYRNAFKPSSFVKSVLENILSEFADFTYGFHIRRTDNLESIKYSPVELFLDKAEEILSSDNNKIFLASDSECVKALFRKKFNNRIITSPFKAQRGTREGMIWGGAEMFALSKTRKIYGSYYSSYSEAAAILGSIPLEQLKI